MYENGSVVPQKSAVCIEVSRFCPSEINPVTDSNSEMTPVEAEK